MHAGAGMTSAGIPQDVRDFVAATIRSVEQLEVLLLLHRNPDRDWTPAQVSAELRTQEHSAAAWLAQLEAGGLLDESAGRYRYAPRAARRATVDELRRCYEVYRVRLIGLIFERQDDAIQSFADAFRIRRRKQ